MKKIIPSIRVSPCKEALDFYQEIFGGEIKNVQTAEVNPMFKGHEGEIVHAELHVNDNCIFHFNDFLGEELKGGNINLMLDLETEEEIRTIYSALSAGGIVIYELQKAFWGTYHAVLTDRYGVEWSLNLAQ